MKQTNQVSTARIKRVFPNHSEVIHRWANQTQTDARCKNVFFEGTSIYSYGSHYELGRLIQFNGKTVAVINDTGYSNTTNKHIHAAWNAVQHMPRVKTKGDFATGCVRRGLVAEQNKLMDHMFSHFSRVSFRSWEKSWGVRGEYGDIGGYAKEVKNFNEKTIEFGFPELALDLNETFVEIFNEKLVQGVERAKVRDADKNEKLRIQEVERQTKALEDVAAWRSGETKYSVTSLSPQILRIKGDQVESSRGASVTLKQAKAFLAAVESGKIKKGAKVGDYEFDGMTKTTVRIGCHMIEKSELRAVIGSLPTLTLVGGE